MCFFTDMLMLAVIDSCLLAVMIKLCKLSVLYSTRLAQISVNSNTIVSTGDKVTTTVNSTSFFFMKFIYNQKKVLIL